MFPAITGSKSKQSNNNQNEALSKLTSSQPTDKDKQQQQPATGGKNNGGKWEKPLKVIGSGGVPVGGVIAAVAASPVPSKDKDNVGINSNENNKASAIILANNKMQKLQLVKSRSTSGGPHDPSHLDTDYDLDYGVDTLALSSPSMRASSPSSVLRTEKQRFSRSAYPAKSNNPGDTPPSSLKYMYFSTRWICEHHIL